MFELCVFQIGAFDQAKVWDDARGTGEARRRRI